MYRVFYRQDMAASEWCCWGKPSQEYISFSWHLSYYFLHSIRLQMTQLRDIKRYNTVRRVEEMVHSIAGEYSLDIGGVEC